MWYTPPATHFEQLVFPEGTIKSTFPASVEAGEQGTLAVAIRNTGKTALSEVHVNLFAERIDFQKDSSSRMAIKDLGSGETKHLTVACSVHGSGTPGAMPVEVAVQCAERAVSSQYAAVWHLRPWPLKRWWTPISALFLLLAAMCKWDVLKQLREPLRMLIGEKQAG